MSTDIVDIRGAAARELVERTQQASSKGEVPSGLGMEVGGTGLKVFGGIITEDHNTTWQAPGMYTIVDKMRRGDSTCAAVLLSIVLPILATDVHIDARLGADRGKSPDPIVQEAADFVEANLFSGEMMKRGWRPLLREVLLYLAYGNYPFEKVFGEVEKGQFAGAVKWEKFAPRHPRTITEWRTNRVGDLIEVRQEVYESEHSLDTTIPVEKLLVFTNQPEAGNPQGISIYRPMYKHWKYKDGFYAVQAIAIERQGAGVPFAKYPAGTPDTEKDKAAEMMENVQAHEQSYFTYEDDWEVGFVDMGSASTLDPQSAIEHHDAMLSKAVLASFMQLPQDGRGSFALSSDQSGFFSHALQEAAGYVASVFNQHAIPQLLDMNYPDLPAYPKLQFDRVGHISVDKLLEHISKLSEKGVLTSDVEVENFVRDALNLPPISEEDFDEANEPEEPVEEGVVGGTE